MKNTAQIEIVEKDIQEIQSILESNNIEKMRDFYYEKMHTYHCIDKARFDYFYIYNNEDYPKALKAFQHSLEMYMATLKDNPTKQTPLFKINNQTTANATINQTITLAQTLQSIQEIPSSSLSDEDRERLEELLASIEGLKNINKEKTKGKISEVLRFLADKGTDAGIAVLPWILEVMKGL